jgi:hypothetical protein
MGPSPLARALASRLLPLASGGGEGTGKGTATASADLAAAIAGALERLAVQLMDVIGASGFQAVVARAAHLARAQAGWPQSVEIRIEGTVRVDGLAEAIAREGPPRVREGALRLFATLIDLLCMFIGKPLTLLLLGRTGLDVSGLGDAPGTEGQSHE